MYRSGTSSKLQFNIPECGNKGQATQIQHKQKENQSHK